MKKFKFKLEKLLSYKNQILQSEMQKLSVILASIHDKEQEIERLTLDKERTGQELDEKFRTEMVQPLEAQRYQHYLDKLRDDIILANKELETLNLERERQIDVIAAAKKESRSLEILKENQFAAYEEENRKASEREIEEFISAREAMSDH